jgi:hypothetical protein
MSHKIGIINSFSHTRKLLSEEKKDASFLCPLEKKNEKSFFQDISNSQVWVHPGEPSHPYAQSQNPVDISHQFHETNAPIYYPDQLARIYLNCLLVEIQPELQPENFFQIIDQIQPHYGRSAYLQAAYNCFTALYSSETPSIQWKKFIDNFYLAYSMHSHDELLEDVLEQLALRTLNKIGFHLIKSSFFPPYLDSSAKLMQKICAFHSCDGPIKIKNFSDRLEAMNQVFEKLPSNYKEICNPLKMAFPCFLSAYSIPCDNSYKIFGHYIYPMNHPSDGFFNTILKILSALPGYFSDDLSFYYPYFDPLLLAFLKTATSKNYRILFFHYGELSNKFDYLKNTSDKIFSIIFPLSEKKLSFLLESKSNQEFFYKLHMHIQNDLCPLLEHYHLSKETLSHYESTVHSLFFSDADPLTSTQKASFIDIFYLCIKCSLIDSIQPTFNITSYDSNYLDLALLSSTLDDCVRLFLLNRHKDVKLLDSLISKMVSLPFLYEKRTLKKDYLQRFNTTFQRFFFKENVEKIHTFISSILKIKDYQNLPDYTSKLTAHPSSLTASTLDEFLIYFNSLKFPLKFEISNYLFLEKNKQKLLDNYNIDCKRISIEIDKQKFQSGQEALFYLLQNTKNEDEAVYFLSFLNNQAVNTLYQKLMQTLSNQDINVYLALKPESVAQLAYQNYLHYSALYKESYTKAFFQEFFHTLTEFAPYEYFVSSFVQNFYPYPSEPTLMLAVAKQNIFFKTKIQEKDLLEFLTFISNQLSKDDLFKKENFSDKFRQKTLPPIQSVYIQLDTKNKKLHLDNYLGLYHVKQDAELLACFKATLDLDCTTGKGNMEIFRESNP